MAKEMSPKQAEMVTAIADEMHAVMTTPLTRSKERYLRELVAVSRAAALGGEYTAAFKGYEAIGKTLGHIVPDQQSVHLHQHAHLTQASDAELAALLAEASARAAKPAQLATDDMLEAICA